MEKRNSKYLIIGIILIIITYGIYTYIQNERAENFTRAIVLLSETSEIVADGYIIGAWTQEEALEEIEEHGERIGEYEELVRKSSGGKIDTLYQLQIDGAKDIVGQSKIKVLLMPQDPEAVEVNKALKEMYGLK